MGFLGKIFRKRGEIEFEPPKDIELPEGVKDITTPEPKSVFEHNIFSQNQEQSQYTTPQYPSPPQSFQQSTQTYPSQTTQSQYRSQDIELILAKLDAIKSEIDAMHQRIKLLEHNRIKEEEKQKRMW